MESYESGMREINLKIYNGASIFDLWEMREFAMRV